MSHCYDNHDLNPDTCKFVKKCPDGKVRNNKFRCVKAPVNHQTALKKRIEKSKIDAEERLRGRTEILKNLFKSKSDEWLNIGENNMREKLMRIRTQTVKRGFDDLTRNVNSLIEKVEGYEVKPRRNRKKTQRRKSVNFSLRSPPQKSPYVSSGLKDPSLKNEFSNDHLDEYDRLNSPDSPQKFQSKASEPDAETLNRYRKAVSNAFATLDLSKLNGMTRRKPHGTSLNSKVKRSKRSRGSS